MHIAAPCLALLKDVDVFCTNAIHEDAQLPDKVRAVGVQFWQYRGTGDHAPAHQARFTFGFFFGAYDSRGSLIWAYDSTNRFDTSNPGGGQWGYGWYAPATASRRTGVERGVDGARHDHSSDGRNRRQEGLVKPS